MSIIKLPTEALPSFSTKKVVRQAREKACFFSYLRCKIKGFFTPLLLKKVKKPPFQAHLRGGGVI